jgi:hypothetical protein
MSDLGENHSKLNQKSLTEGKNRRNVKKEEKGMTE